MDFREYQQIFAAHVRDPRGAPRPSGVPARRMRVYNELLYNNIEGFLLACFPVCRRLLGQRAWTRLVRAFFRDHVCATPYFRRIPAEFLDYLAAGGAEGYPDFLAELAHWEWVELDLDTADASLPAHDPDGDLLAGHVVLNPVMHVLTYGYPVHRLAPRHKPATPPSEPTFLLAFRDQDARVRFEAVNAGTARLLTLLGEHPGWTGSEVINCLAGEIRHPDPAALRHHAGALLDALRARGAVLGISPASCR